MKVSIIIPYKEDRGYLKEAIKSIEDQTYPDIELILSQGNATWPTNFNKGLEKATGEFVRWVHDDDWLIENGIELLVKGIEGFPWVYGNAYEWTQRKKASYFRPEYTQETDSSYLYKPGTTDFKSMVERNVIHGGSILYRTDVLREIGGMNGDLWTGEEYELNLRLLSKGFIPNYIDVPIYVYRVWDGQKTKGYAKDRDVKRKRQAEIERIKNMYR